MSRGVKAGLTPWEPARALQLYRAMYEKREPQSTARLV
jgi:hypothetical protein